MAGFVKLLIACILENLAGGGGGVEGGRAFVKKLEDVWNHSGSWLVGGRVPLLRERNGRVPLLRDR